MYGLMFILLLLIFASVFVYFFNPPEKRRQFMKQMPFAMPILFLILFGLPFLFFLLAPIKNFTGNVVSVTKQSFLFPATFEVHSSKGEICDLSVEWPFVTHVYDAEGKTIPLSEIANGDTIIVEYKEVHSSSRGNYDDPIYIKKINPEKEQFK
jgi:amino acid transporter